MTREIPLPNRAGLRLSGITGRMDMMSDRDLWFLLTQTGLRPQDAIERRDEKIERIFAEIAQELGIDELDSPGPDKPEAGTVIYDKFSGRGE